MDKHYNSPDRMEAQELRALDGIHARLVRINNRIRSTEEVLESTADRIFGALPRGSVETRALAENAPDSAVNKLHAALSVLDNIAERMEGIAERLNGV